MSRNQNTNGSAKGVAIIIAIVFALNIFGAVFGSIVNGSSRAFGVIPMLIFVFVLIKVVTAFAKNAKRSEDARQRNPQGVRTFGNLETDVYRANAGAFEAKATGNTNSRNRNGRGSTSQSTGRTAGYTANRREASYRASSTVQVSGVNGWEGGRSRHLFHSEPFEQNDGLRHQSWPPRGGFQ